MCVFVCPLVVCVGEYDCMLICIMMLCWSQYICLIIILCGKHIVCLFYFSSKFVDGGSIIVQKKTRFIIDDNNTVRVKLKGFFF